MQKQFEQEAGQLVVKGWILFYGYCVVISPCKAFQPCVVVDRVSNCFCIELPDDRREAWAEWVRQALGYLYKVKVRKIDDNIQSV